MRLVREASSVAMVATTRMADYGSWAAYFSRDAWRRLCKGLLRPVEKMKPIHRSQNLSLSSFSMGEVLFLPGGLYVISARQAERVLQAEVAFHSDNEATVEN